MRNWKRSSTLSFVLAALLLAVLFILPVQAQDNAVPPLQEASDAYVALVQADQARDRSDWKAAAQGYRDAIQRYTRLGKQYPTWEPDIVQYRVAYCMNQAEVISQKTGSSSGAPPAGAAAAPAAAAVAVPAAAATNEPAGDSYRERDLALLEENQYLRQRTAELQGAADEAAEQAAPAAAEEADGVAEVAVEKELAEVLMENAGLKARVRELEAQAGTREAACHAGPS